jgi:hypothetical protein
MVPEPVPGPSGVDEWPTGQLTPYNRKHPKQPSFEDRLVDRYFHDTCKHSATIVSLHGYSFMSVAPEWAAIIGWQAGPSHA